MHDASTGNGNRTHAVHPLVRGWRAIILPLNALKSQRKTTNKKKSMSKKIAKEEVIRIWGETPVVDALRDLRVIVQPCDVEGATQKDPGSCVFARACKRSFGARKVMFLREVAYVELPDELGNLRVERFMLPQTVRDLIRNFDIGNSIIPKGGFLLTAPTPARTLEWKKKAQQKRYHLRKEALIKGVNIYPSRTKRREEKTKSVVIDAEVRNGRGMVHFVNSLP